jgi:hypothetical protein
LKRLERDKELYEKELCEYEQKLLHMSSCGEECEIRYVQNQISETRMALLAVQKQLDAYLQDRADL